jgi:hypothetical protein
VELVNDCVPQLNKTLWCPLTRLAFKVML